MNLRYLHEFVVIKSDYINIKGLTAKLIGNGDRMQVKFNSAFDTRTSTKVGDRAFIITLEQYYLFYKKHEDKNEGK